MNLDQVGQEALAQIKKASTSGMLTATGLQGIDLMGIIQNIPVPASWYNMLAQTTPDEGGPFAIWRVMTNINNQQLNPATAFDSAAPLHKDNLITVSVPYQKLGYGYTVTKDAVALARGFDDAHAREVFSTMGQYKIGADRIALGGQNFALQTPGTPSVAQSDTGGSIAASTAVNVKVAARTATNYYYGGSTVASAQGSVTTSTVAAATHSATATVVAVPGAVAYDWFVAGFYYTTTIVNKVTITSIPTANQAVPTLPNLSTVAPTSVPAVDASANPNEFNGLLATLAGDYNSAANGNGLVTHGSGNPSGAVFTSLDGAAFTGSGQNINELDALNDAIYQATFLSPDAYMCSSKDAAALSKLILSSGTQNTYFTPGADGRSDVTAGGFIGHYVNKSAGGVPVRIEVHPNMVPGTLIARTDRVNFPNAGYSNVFELRNLDTLQDFQYGAARTAGVGGGPRWDGEVYSSSALINRAPAAQAVLYNIQS